MTHHSPPTRKCTAVEVAELVRAEIRTAVLAGTIRLPHGAKVTVRTVNYAAGREVAVRVLGAPAGWGWTPAAFDLRTAIGEILAKHLDDQWGSVSC